MEDDDKLGINADRTILLYYGHIAWVGEAAVLMTYKYLLNIYDKIIWDY